MWIPFGKPAAVARISGNSSAPCLHGTVKFHQMGTYTMIVADIYGLPKTDTGIFALHIHEGQSCKENFMLTGNHYNPGQVPHPNHAGDLPPLFSCDGRAFLASLTGRFSLPDVMGRTVVIHRDVDDFHSQPGGNAGEKIACGVIVPC